MSISHRLLLVIVLAVATAISGATTAVVLIARDNVLMRLSHQAAQIAEFVGRGVANTNGDQEVAKRLTDGVIGGGHVRHIRIEFTDGTPFVEARPQQTPPALAPAWFAQLMNLPNIVVNATPGNGWRNVARVAVEPDPTAAIGELWSAAREVGGWLLLIGVATCLLALLLLRRQLQTLTQIAEQASAILHNRFEPLPAPPTTSTLAPVIQAMNRLVARMQLDFRDAATRCERLRQQVLSDRTTGLPNRRWFEGRLHEALYAEDENGYGALLLLRLPRLDERNRQEGFAPTDRWLREVAARLAAFGSRQDGWAAARLRGADFALLASGLSPGDEPRQLAEELLQTLDELADTDPAFAPIIGITHYQAAADPAALLRSADAALARAEQEPRRWWQDTDVNAAEITAAPRRDWPQLLHKALEDEHLALVGQTVFAGDGSVLHHEALARLPVAGEDTPLNAGLFFPVAERLGLAADFDRLIVLLVLDELLQTRRPLAVNLSAAALADPGFLDFLAIELGRHAGLAPWLIFETRESVVLSDLERGIAFVATLRRLGCRFGLDHVGRQFPSLDYLSRLGVEYLKLDGSFVRGIDREPAQRAFIEALVHTAHSIGVKVIAERIETSVEAADLRELGIDGLQGHALAHPQALGSLL